MELELTVVTGGERRDVVARLGDGATVAQLRAALGLGAGPGLWVRDRFADGGLTVAAASIRSGDLLGADRPVAVRQPTAIGPAALAVVGGLDAGSARPFGPTGIRVGRSPESDLRLRDGEVSREHAHVGVGVDGTVHVTDVGSRNGVGHRATRIAGETDLPLGECLRVGESMLAAQAVRTVLADLTDDPATGIRAFNRMPAIGAPTATPTLVRPTPPAKPRGFRMPWAAALLPLVLGAVIYVVFPQFGGYLIITMALSPVLLVANAITERRGGKKSYSSRMREYTADKRHYDGALEAVAREDERSSRVDAPDPAEVVRRAVQLDAALWQRRRGTDRFLDLRVGLVDRPADVILRNSAQNSEQQDEPAVPTVHDVPLTVPLADAGVLGIAAPRPALLAAARASVLQLGTLHSPGELAITVLTGDDTADDWRWALWLPHLSPLTGETGRFACRRLVAVDGDQAAARVAELQRLVDERTEQQRALLAAGPAKGRAVVVVIDGARRMRAVPGIAKLLATGPAVGVHAVCLDADETALPDECGATVVASTATGSRARVRVGGRTPVEDVLLDGVGADVAETAARSLTPLVALGDGDGGRELPDTVRFTELAGIEVAGGDADAAVVAGHWSGTGRSSKAIIGTGAGGPVEIDLVKDGPHALVAGTSGAGKSELLQTLVASLAMRNRPDALNFVLVDYKGGSAFAACADLPHCAGLITDLDGHLVGRALESLSAELKRRESLLAEVGAKDIADYWARTAGRDAVTLPRLVIVVDEFASLVEEVPEFVPGVVGIGMRGRSLGVHVVLATQRPGGVVTADMRANLNLRICLRVTSEAESGDVIDSPAAARILPRQPGRAYVRTGHSELTAFQAARVGWPRQERSPSIDAGPSIEIDTFGIRGAGSAPAVVVTSDVDEHGRTDLSDLVHAMRVAASDHESPRRPWLPALPAEVPVEALPAVSHRATRAVLGVVDRPATQSQDVFAIDLEETGPVVIAGAVRSGRSTALRTLAGSLAAAASPEDLHLFALDCGNHALAALDTLPHCGAVVDGSDQIRTARLFALLADEITRRQRTFLAGGFGSLAEQRAQVGGDARLPYVVLMLDRLESFVGRYEDVDNGALIDKLELVLRAGPSVGVCAVLATDRTGLTHRIGSAVGARLVLAQATRDDLAYFGVDQRTAPTHMPPGRSIWTPTGEEVQVAFAGTDPSGSAQLARLRELGATLAHRWDRLPAARRPRRLDVLPESVDATEVAALRETARPAGTLTLGVGGDHLAPVDLDLDSLGGCFVVCGASRSGRSTALRAMVDSIDTTLPVVVASPRPSPLRDLAGENVTVIASDVETTLVSRLATGEPCVLVVDDAELLDDLTLGPVLEQFVRSARDTGSLVLAAATTEDVLMNRYRGWLATARRDRTGLILNPASHVDGEVFDLRLPRSLSGGWTAGRGVLVTGGDTATVQVTNAVTKAAAAVTA